MHLLVKQLVQMLIRAVSLALPETRANKLERWRRGREDNWKFKRCDYVFVSHGKSGRTWARVMISRYFKLAHPNIPDGIILGFDNFHKLNTAVPKIFFTHDNYLRRYLGNENSRKNYYDRKIVLLVRQPQDVAVSQYFQWKHRMKAYKKKLNNYPEHNADLSVYDVVMHQGQGLPRIVRGLNEWIAELSNFKDLLVIRYEDLRVQPEHELTRLMDFLGEAVDPEIVMQAVEFASAENLRKMETENHFWRSGSRMKATDLANPDSYKVRKAKVGGYRDYFDDEEVARIDAFVEENLKPGFGYTAVEKTGGSWLQSHDHGQPTKQSATL
jgi:hypothetical protein